jgi:hypothetical protein
MGCATFICIVQENRASLDSLAHTCASLTRKNTTPPSNETRITRDNLMTGVLDQPGHTFKIACIICIIRRYIIIIKLVITFTMVKIKDGAAW